MDTLKNIFSFKKKDNNNNNSNNTINYNQSEVDGFLVYSNNESINKDIKKSNSFPIIQNLINPNEIKDAQFYKKMWENAEEFDELKESIQLFEELWTNISQIINNNLIDFTCK
jgi:hypothetical protein